ncbi:hypothetical protein BJX65DRAFT_298237 [Aspergillus insuetus]
MASIISLTADDYTVALICAMSVEQAPVEALLDEIHPDLPTTTLDKNTYTYGRMHKHNVVIAASPRTGNTSAASVATQVLNDFRNLQFGLLIGIGGGLPDLDRGVDIRLGDVVVSKPEGTFGGVVQLCRGKSLAGGGFERTGSLNSPPHVLLAAAGRLEGVHRRVNSAISSFIHEMLERYPKMKAGGYVHQGPENDKLFQAESEHRGGGICSACDSAALVQRAPRTLFHLVIQHGTIGDKIRDDLRLCCIESEAAGLKESFSCLNDRWQPYAAAAAAAYAKELLSYVPVLNRPQNDLSKDSD